MHFQLLPVKVSLKDPTCSSMLRVLRLALAVCASIYAIVAISGGCLRRAAAMHAACCWAVGRPS